MISLFGRDTNNLSQKNFFEIFDVPTRNPPTYNLIDANKEPIEGKFYEPELIRVVEKVEKEEKEEEEEEEEEEAQEQEQEQEYQP